MKCLFNKHKFETVAIDEGHSWYYAKDKKVSYDHIIVYDVCKKCGEREMRYDDSTEQGRKYAKEGNSDVASDRSIWLNTGKIKGTKKTEFFDDEYAPAHYTIDTLEKQLKKKSNLGDMINDNPMVQDALNQFLTVLKLHKK